VQTPARASACTGAAGGVKEVGRGYPISTAGRAAGGARGARPARPNQCRRDPLYYGG